MRSRVVARLLTLTIVAACLVSESAAQPNAPKPQADSVVLPVTGTSSGGRFSGLLTLHRFASDGNGGIVAVGVISGTVGRRTAITPVSLPVTEIKGRQTVVFSRPSQTGFIPAPSGTRAVWDHELPAPAPGIVLAQAEPCDLLSITIGGIALDILGLQVNLAPIMLEISGDTAGLLGNLICSVLGLVGGLVDTIVGLLNAILGLLGGLTGGLGA